MDKIEINIGIFGAVSVGKSTFLNAIFGQQFSDVEIKKTTMVPQVYSLEIEDSCDVEAIRLKNREINESIMKTINSNNFSIDQCKPVYYCINNTCDIFDHNINDDFKINIYDIPGLNDSASKNIYFEWVRQNIKIFDIIIFMTDINNGLNNSDEIEILELLMDSIKKYKMKMVCLINKCDDIYYDDQLSDLVFEEKEQENIYIQANNILIDISKKYLIDSIDFFTPFIPISCENCFIYRALIRDPSQELDQIYQNRLCKNECGMNQWKKMNVGEKNILFKNIFENLKDTYHSKILDTGYYAVKTIIQKTLIDGKNKFILNHMENEMPEIEDCNHINITLYFEAINNYIQKFKIYSVCNDDLSEIFWNYFSKAVDNFLDKILPINTQIIKNGEYICLKDFELLHYSFQINNINFIQLTENLPKMPSRIQNFITIKRDQLMFKLLDIYDQLGTVEKTNQIHIHPANLLNYLQNIKKYIPGKFGIYVSKFLEIIRNIKYRQIFLDKSEFTDLVVFMIKNSPESFNKLAVLVVAILINRQQFIAVNNPQEYFNYLIQSKKLIKRLIKKISINNYTPFDILLETTNKNISLYLSTNSIVNIYRQNIDQNKINNELEFFYNQGHRNILLKFENDLLEAFGYPIS